MSRADCHRARTPYCDDVWAHAARSFAGGAGRVAAEGFQIDLSLPKIIPSKFSLSPSIIGTLTTKVR